jgi:hypothetical protein
VVRAGRQRKLQKAFLRYHDPENWPLLREALKAMGRADLIGRGKRHLIPAWQPAGTGTKPLPQKSGQNSGANLQVKKSALATRRITPSVPAKPARTAKANRNPNLPRHPLSRRTGG